MLSALAGAFAQPAYQSGEVIVKFKDSAPFRALQVQALAGARLVSENASIGACLVDLPVGMNVEHAARFYRSLRNVEYAEPNYILQTKLVPNDPAYGQQYGLAKMQCAAAWDLSTGDPGVVIAIVDTGVQLNHGDLAAKIVPGYDFVNGDTSADDDNGHGTHCAGIAAAVTNNGVGIAGVGFQCKIMPVKVLNAQGSGTISNVANGITWAVDNGAKVVSLSLGGSSGSQALQSAVDYAWNNGVVVVAAAGNENTSQPAYPGYYTNCIAVGSTDQNDQRSSFSNYGNWVDVAAPGSSIYSTYTGGGYQTLSGTSMATPAVAGLAGLLWSRLGGGATNSQVRNRIESTTDSVGTWLVKGRVNAQSALTGTGGGGPPALHTLAITPGTVFGGAAAQGTVNLTNSAPSGGFVVNLSSTNSKAAVPASITVPAGQSSATFTVTTSAVTADITAQIRATSGAVSRTASLKVRAPMDLSSLVLTRSSIRGLSVLGGRVTLTNTAPPEGVVVVISASNGAARVPSTVRIRPGQRTASFSIHTSRVAVTTDVVIAASYGGVTKTANLRVTR